MPLTALFIATPCYGGQTSAIYMRSLLALRAAAAERSVGLHIELGGGEALIGRGRATLMAQFLASAATHLLFIDADVGFEPAAAFRLLESGKPLVGGVYPKKLQTPSEPIAWEVEELPDAGDETLRPVASIGAGFLLIARAAAEQLVVAFPQLKAQLGDLAGGQARQAVMLFDSFVDPETGRYLSDYQAFCHRWRATGGEVWADFASPLQHIGAIVRGSETAAAR